MKKSIGIVFCLLTALVMSRSAAASPITLDCSAGCNMELFGGAYWSTASIQPSGTGVFKPFVRLQALGNDTNEDGHNTDGVLSNDEKAGIWTHSVKTADLYDVLINGQAYYEFMLDIGEPATTNKSKLSIDEIQVCTGDSGSLTALNGCPTAPTTFDLDAGQDRAVILDYGLFGGGNGNSDLFMYLPASSLLNAKPYFYLYSAMGYQDGATAAGSFEEWAFRDSTGVPDGGLTIALLGMSLAGMGLVARRLTK